MREVSSMNNTENITLSINKNQLKELVNNDLPDGHGRDTEIKTLEKKIVELQNTILILENDLELNILQNIETIIKQEEFLLEINQIISNLEMKNENYQATILKQTKELKKINDKYKKLKKSKLGSIVVKYWDLRRKLKSR